MRKDMKNNKENSRFNQTSKINSTYLISDLPVSVEEGHEDLTRFGTGCYSLLNKDCLRGIVEECETKISQSIETSDIYTMGETFDSYVDSQMQIQKNMHESEVIDNEWYGGRIMNTCRARIQELKERIPRAEEKSIELRNRIEVLKDKKAKHAVRFGGKIIQLGMPVTLLALAVDFFVNKSFIETILYYNEVMLYILVICLCLMSDGTMAALGSMISRKALDQEAQTEHGTRMSRYLHRVLCAGFLGLFAVSVIGSNAR